MPVGQRGGAAMIVPELGCTDFAKSRRFYTEVLGFSVEYERVEEGFAMLSREGARLMLDQLGVGRTWLLGAAEYPLGRGMNLQIDVADVEALYERVVAVRADVFMPLEEKWYRADDVEVGSRQFIVQDPDGYLLRFAQTLGKRMV